MRVVRKIVRNTAIGLAIVLVLGFGIWLGYMMWDAAKSAYDIGALSSIHTAIAKELAVSNGVFTTYFKNHATEEWQTLSGGSYLWFLKELKSRHPLDPSLGQWEDARGGEYQISFRRNAQLCISG